MRIMPKVIWRSNIFLLERCKKNLLFSNGWVMGVYSRGSHVIMVNERIAKRKHPQLSFIDVVFHEWLHSLKIPLIDHSIDWFCWLCNRKISRCHK